MKSDIDGVLRDWAFEPGTVQARLAEAGDGRSVLQMRIDLGVMQMELTGRPDGDKPKGYPHYLGFLRSLARRNDKFVLDDEQCQESDREFLQYYHRRVCWLALRNYTRAIADADHTLDFMDFVRDHAPNDDFVQAHEQYRPFVLFHRTQAAAALQIEKERPDQAVDEIRQGLDKIRDFYVGVGAEEAMEEDGMVHRLRLIEAELREKHGIGATLAEELEKAVASEDYEKAARIRDEMKKRASQH